MHLEVGDIVAFLNSTGTGTVKQIDGDSCLIEDEHGFDEWVLVKELILRKKLEINEVQSKDPMNRKGLEPTRFHRNELISDLHFDQLVEFPKNFTSHQKLEIQLREARKAIDRARAGGIKKVILIHGVGAGRLKEEIHTLLERMDRVNFFDASYAEYGSGATEVQLY